MTRRRRTILGCIAVVGLVVGVLALVGPSSPSGRYVSKGILVGGDCYWQFSEGRVSFVYWDGRDDTFGTYTKTNGDWFWTNDHGKGKPSTFRVRCTWAGLHFYDESGKEVEFLRRRFIPFMRPNWIPEAIQ